MASRHPEQLRTAINWGMHHQFDGVTCSGLADAAMDAIPDGWGKVDGEWVQFRASEDGIGDRCYYTTPEEL